MASSLDLRLPLPYDFLSEVKEKISEMVQDSQECEVDYSDHKVLKREHDEQLLLWLNQ